MLIAEGQVQVNGEVRTRCGRKLRQGDVVQLSTQCIRVQPAP